MEIIKTSFEGLFIIQPKIISDRRGYFMESFKSDFFNTNFPHIDFVQENEKLFVYNRDRERNVIEHYNFASGLFQNITS